MKHQKQLSKGFLIIALLTLCLQFDLSANNPDNKDNTEFKVSIIYDNYDFKSGMKSDWGFSCLIEGASKTILFDTGKSSGIFKNNFKSLEINPKLIDFVIISHDHHDHVGGLSTFLEMNSDVSVFIAPSFSDKVKNTILNHNVQIEIAKEIQEICPNVYLSGILGTSIDEQSLAIDTEKGLVIITGCSHPGIINILNHFKSSLNKDIYMVIGGFHLMRNNTSEINAIIKDMKNIGVQKCGATHCTGDKQIQLFKEAFDDNFLQMGVGRVVVIK